jgi:amino acid adenylation domain-containing protein
MFEYNVDLFEASTIERFIGYFQLLLEAMIARPEQRLSSLSLLTAAERQRTLVEWNTTQSMYPDHRCIHELFEAQVEQTPHAIALIHGDTRMPYAELNRRANQLAQYLTRLGVGPESRVAVCVERSPEMVVALLGVLKAGGAYIPLDPAYPAERLAFMLSDAQPLVLLTEQRLNRGQWTTNGGSVPHVVYLDTDRQVIAQQPDQNPNSGVAPDNLCYITYTSGSTGRPKGVLACHRASINRFAWMWQTYPFAPDDVGCQKTALSFVDSVWELFGPLLKGIPVTIIPDDLLKDMARLFDTLAAQRVTRIVLVPSLLRVMLEAADDLQRRIPTLKLWISSGETLAPELSRLFAERLPNATLLNLYGSSEVAADATWHMVREHQSAERIPIGRPIANTHIYLLDSQMRPTPIGAPGEVYVGGAGLARGYHNRPDLTAERFVPNPFGALAHDAALGPRYSRLYKTGDLARYRPDGVIEYLGRIDHQVKVRGMRIELGEIETTLRRHESVQQAVVVAREKTPGDMRLNAYIVPAHDMTDANASGAVSLDEGHRSADLRAFLQQRLPDYMTPSMFVFLPALPLTPSGKIDRRALPEPDWSQPTSENAYVAPRNAVEQALAKIWEQVLGVTQVGVYDNFFTLGGHSLIGIQVLSRVRAAFQVDLPVRPNGRRYGPGADRARADAGTGRVDCAATPTG